MTDHDEAVVPLGRRLDALARARMDALAPRPAWAPPLAVTLRRSEDVAGVLGERFERTETPPRAPAEFPVEPAHAPVPRRDAPGTWAERQARDARQRRAQNRGGGATEPPPEPWLLGEAGFVETPDDDDLREVPADVRSRLRREVGRAADLMRVHAGRAADAQARAVDADAVTKGRDVYLRQGRWAPRREEGVALLAHEATHVAALVDPGTAARRAVGGMAEEALARARERSMLGPGAGPSPTAPGGGPEWPGVLETSATRFGAAAGSGDPRQSATEAYGARPAPAAAPAAPSAPPAVAVQGPGVRAGVDRDLTPPAAAPDLDALRRGVIAEVMQRLRSEIERGA